MNCPFFVFAMALCIALPGCATVVQGTSQSVAISTPPANGARCVVSSPAGSYTVTTPGNATVRRTGNDLDIACDKPGFQHATLKVAAHFNVPTPGNLLAGGIVGLGVDAVTGANFNYPTEIVVPMTASNAAPVAALSPIALH
jgi:hypothetical protein